MKKLVGLLVLIGVLTGCGATPAPTKVPPTQTPWIIVVTSTPGPEDVSEVQPTQTPWIIIATPTRTSKITPTPEERATEGTEPPGTEPTAERTTEATSEPSATEAKPTSSVPTVTPDPSNLKYPAPVLLDPPSGIPVEWKGTIRLVWDGVGELAEDEYYHVHLERPPPSDVVPWWGDYVYTKDTFLFVDQSFLAPFHLAAEHGRANVYWWVRVVRKTGEDDNGKPVGVDVGLPSERWFFVVEPSAGD